VHVGKKVVELLIVEGGAGHGAVTVEDYGGQAFVSGWRAGGHGFDFGEGLKAGTMEPSGGRGVMAFCAGLLEHGCAASFFGCPLGSWLGGGQRLAPGQGEGCGAGKQREEKA
jgi:hypothetical protein